MRKIYFGIMLIGLSGVSSFKEDKSDGVTLILAIGGFWLILWGYLQINKNR